MDTVLTIIGAILLALFVGWINGRNNRINRLAISSDKFRNTFIKELEDIYPHPVNWPENIDGFLRTKFTALQAAVKLYGDILPWHKRYFFYKAWFRYRCATGRKIDTQSYLHYIPTSGVSLINGKEIFHDNTKTYKQDFKYNVDSILKYAKFK